MRDFAPGYDRLGSRFGHLAVLVQCPVWPKADMAGGLRTALLNKRPLLSAPILFRIALHRWCRRAFENLSQSRERLPVCARACPPRQAAR
jgi:hypothetical protein